MVAAHLSKRARCSAISRGFRQAKVRRGRRNDCRYKMANRKKPFPAKPTTPMSVKTHTGWIRDTERAMRASGFDYIAKLVFFEMIDHTSENDRTCWAAFGTMAIRLNVTPPTVRKYSNELIKGKAIRRVGKGPKGTIRFEILDGWANASMDAMTIRLDKFREAETARKAKSRAKPKASVTQASLRPEPSKSRNDGFDMSRNDGFDKHLQPTPSKVISERGENPYAAAKARI
jgi:Helix-turn-helix domain